MRETTADRVADRQVAATDRAMAWWRRARFGMFVHWGLYAIPAGVWRGKRVPYIGEWLMFREKIPVATYAKLADQFNPTRFDAAAWVGLAKAAGAGYLVVTSKHHDGFALFDSKADPYNSVRASPWGRDAMAELAAECHRQGIKLCFYYSQDLDWHHPDGAWNDWDYDPAAKDPDRYLREKVLPQLRELLTRYGPVGMIWFDTPLTLTKAQSARIRRHVKRLQPECLVSGRIGHGLGDYRLPRDNFLPPGRLEGDWESCATLNHTWGYKQHDHAWKPAAELITTLVDLASKGANYLLNVGPDARGVIPAASARRLHAMGDWLRVNGVAIYGTAPSPYRYDFPWGRITTRGRTLYLHLFGRPPRRLELRGLRTRVRGATALAEPTLTLPHEQPKPTSGKVPVLLLDLRGLRRTGPVTVVVLRLAGAAEVEPLSLQQPDDSVTLIGPMASVGSDAARPSLRMGGSGLTENWRETADWLVWRFTVLTPGRMAVTVVTTQQHLEPWSGGHTLCLSCDGQQLRRKTRRDALLPGLRSTYYPQISTEFGVLELSAPGTYGLRLQAERLNLPKKNQTLFSDGGMQFSEIRLTPV